MPTVPSSLLKRKSGPPAPPPQQGAALSTDGVAAFPDTPVAAGMVAGILTPDVATVAQEQQEVTSILQSYAAALPAGEPLAVMAQTLADVTPTLSARALSVLSPVIVDLTVHAQNALAAGDPMMPTPITLPQTYMDRFKSFLETQAVKELQHLATGLQDSLQRQQAAHAAKQTQTDRIGTDISAGYPHLIQQLAQASEKIGTLGPVNWGLLAESAESAGLLDVRDMLADSSSNAFQQQQQLETEARASHAVAHDSLKSQQQHGQQVQIMSALVAGVQAAVTGVGPTALSTDQLKSVMLSGAKKALTDELKRLTKRSQSRRPKAIESPVVLAGDTYIDPDLA